MVLALPDIRQRDNYSCGPTCARCVLEYFGLTKRGAGAGTTPIDGTDPRTLEGFLRRAGLLVQSGEMTTEDLQHHTRCGRPVIALVTFGGEGHYVVVAGVHRGRVHFQDPWQGPGFMRKAEFLVSWVASGDRFGARYDRWAIATLKADSRF